MELITNIAFKCIFCGFRCLKGFMIELNNISQQNLNRLLSWIAPRKVDACSVLCNHCNDLLKLDITRDEAWLMRTHKKVCIVCGKSVLRGRSIDLAKTNNPEYIQVRELIITEVPKITDEELICDCCRQKIIRKKNHFNSSNVRKDQISKPNNKGIINDENNVEYESNKQLLRQMTRDNLELLKQYEEDNLNSKYAKPSNNHCENETEVKMISLQSYRRCYVTNKCLFYKCVNKPEEQLTEDIRLALIANYNMYSIPQAKVCKYHLGLGRWGFLWQKENSTTFFTGQQIEDLYQLIAYGCSRKYPNYKYQKKLRKLKLKRVV